MKCPKCKYTTFDYADTCPRCGKDISGEKSKLNILSIQPNTPFLLGSLTGDLDDSSASFVVPESVKEAAGESMKIDTGEIFDDGSELNINIDEKVASESGREPDLGGPGSSDADQELEMDFDSEDVSSEIKEPDEVQEAGSDFEEGGVQKDVTEKGTQEEPEALDLDVEDLDLKLDLGEEDDSDR